MVGKNIKNTLRKETKLRKMTHTTIIQKVYVLSSDINF